MHGLRLGDNAVRQLENLRCRKIHTHVRTSKIWCNSTSTHAIKENIEKKGRVNDTKAGRVWKKINFGEKKEKKRPLRFLFLVWALTAEIARFMASARRAADPVRASRLYLLSFFSLTIFSLFLSSCGCWTDFLAHQTDKCEGN